jgi:kynurenine formamidase
MSSTDEGERPVSIEPLDQIVAGLAGSELVDLTVTLAEDLPAAWPTHMPFQRKVYNWFATRREGQIQPVHSLTGPYQTAWMVLDEHCGTHVDAPAHFIPPPGSGLPFAGEFGTHTVETIDLRRLTGPAAMIDVTELSGQGEGGVSPEISPEQIERWEAANGRLQPGDIALFRSDWDDRYRRTPDGSSYVLDPFLLQRGPGWPTPGVPALQLLLDRGVSTIGLDGVSVGSSHDGPTAHRFGLGRGMLFIELLANLRLLPPRGAFFVCLPLKIEGGTAAPCRAIALVPRATRE